MADAILGCDMRTVVVGGKAYTVYPPTIHKIVGATTHLAGVKDGESIHDILLSMSESDKISKALSWLICDNESLAEELSKGEYGEVVDALEEALSLIDAKVFTKAVSLAKSASLLIAKPRQ